MKKIRLILLAVLTGVSLCACEYDMSKDTSQVTSKKEAVTENTDTELFMQAPSLTPSTTPSLTPMAQMEAAKIPEQVADENLEKRLKEILSDISLNYHNSTAGCSLKAAVFAGKLLDWWKESSQTSVTMVDVKEVTKEFYEKLSTDQALEISEQMDAIYFAAQRVTEEGGAELLDVAGYEAKFGPWEKQEVTDLFTEIYVGISSKMPEENESHL